jgi:hypothetical protein
LDKREARLGKNYPSLSHHGKHLNVCCPCLTTIPKRRDKRGSRIKSAVRRGDKMTYKYHEKVAKLFRDTVAPTETVEGYIDIAKEDNPQFDAVGFRAVAMDWDGIWTT